MRLDLLHSILGRLLPTFLLATLLLAHAPQAFAQQAGIGYVRDSGVYVSERHETNTRIVIDFWDNQDRFLGSRICFAPGVCNYTPPNGTARYAMALEYDSSREELMSDSCGGVANTVAQGQCINSPLNVRMRLRHGTVRWRFVPDERPGRPYSAPLYGGFGGAEARLEFDSTDGSTGRKHWEPRTFRSVPEGLPTAAGNYDVVIPLSGPCKPVHTNPTERLSVREGQLTEFTVRYTGTVCTIAVQNYDNADPDDAGSVVSEPAGMNCTARAGFRTCKAEFAFDSTPRIIARPASGWQSSFGRNFTGCSRAVADPGTCEILADGDRELTVEFYPATVPPPPPPPVTLSVALGAGTPMDGTAAKGSNGVGLIQLMLTPANGAVRLQALTLQASGSGRDDTDLTEVRLHRDANRNGIADSGDTLLARGRFTADNGSLRLALDAPLEFSEATAVLVVADVASTVHTAAAAAAGGMLSALALVALLRPPGWQRAMRVCLVPVLVVMAIGLAGCGGAGEATVAPEPPVAAPPTTPPPTTPPATPPTTPPTPVLVTYRVQAVAIEATDAASAPTTLTATGMPLSGAVITVEQ